MLLVGPNGGEDLRPWNEQLESFGASYISPLMEQIWNQNSTSELYSSKHYLQTLLSLDEKFGFEDRIMPINEAVNW